MPFSGWPLQFEELTPWLNVAADILEVRNFDKMGIEHFRNCHTVKTCTADGLAELRTFFWSQAMRMGPRHLKLLKQSRNVHLLFNATAAELMSDDTVSSVSTLAVSVAGFNTFRIRARMYVLAAGGLENPRLLLASAREATTGIGNARDQVGRYYMDHPRGEGLACVNFQGLARAEIDNVVMLAETIGTPFGKTQLRVTFPSHMQREEELLNHSLHANLSSETHESIGYRSAKRLWQRVKGAEIEPGGSIRDEFSASLKAAPRLLTFGGRRLLGMAGPTKMWLIDQLEQAPDPLSRVIVDLRQRDRYNLPKLTLDWRIGEATYRSQRRMHQLVKGIFNRAGITAFESAVLDRPDERPKLLDMKHPMGTTRMSQSSRDGVVDRDCRVYGVRNLFVAGSSVFPTGGHANPTLLIVALAARLASHLNHLSKSPGGVQPGFVGGSQS